MQVGWASESTFTSTRNPEQEVTDKIPNSISGINKQIIKGKKQKQETLTKNETT